MKKRLDLVGQRYGKLTVLRPAEDIGGVTAWVCRCDCGQEAVVRTCNLRNGGTKSCGCQRRSKITQMVRARKNNTSSVSGVEWLPLRNRWKATICFNRRRYFLGEYPNFEDAVKVRMQAEKARKQAEEELHDNFMREFAIAQVQDAGE